MTKYPVIRRRQTARGSIWSRLPRGALDSPDSSAHAVYPAASPLWGEVGQMSEQARPRRWFERASGLVAIVFGAVLILSSVGCSLEGSEPDRKATDKPVAA